jgi:hypothetical protein
MIGHGVVEKLEPEGGDSGKDPALVRNARAKYVVERGDAIGRDQQQRVAQGVYVADLALRDQGQRAKAGF